jgi:hypothetical protein
MKIENQLFVAFYRLSIPVEVIRKILLLRWPCLVKSVLNKMVPCRPPVLSMMYKDFYVRTNCNSCISLLNSDNEPSIATTANFTYLHLTPSPWLPPLLPANLPGMLLHSSVSFTCVHARQFEVVHMWQLNNICDD